MLKVQKPKIWIAIIIILSLYMTLFTGFCRGWWWLDNIWAHYWWRCACGAEFEQNLYPEDVTVIVSSCREVTQSWLSPDGRYLAVQDNRGRQLIDFVTNQERAWPHPLEGYGTHFWTETLYLIGANKEWQLLDVTDNQFLNLQAFEVITIRGEESDMPAAALAPFRQADQVYVSRSGTMALALAAEPKQAEAMNYVLLFNRTNGVVGPYDIVNQLFEKYEITYTQLTGACNPVMRNGVEICLSPDGRFVTTAGVNGIATRDGRGITGRVKGEGLFIYSSGLIGWAHDNSGLYAGIGHEYISGEPGGMFNLGLSLSPKIKLPDMAIIKIELPEEYR